MVKRMLELILYSPPPGRLWFIGRTPAGKAQDALNLTLRATMLFGPLICH
jgi:hypothetical protein